MSAEPEIENFVEQWIGEFGRAVEMFTGETPVLTYTLVVPAARQQIEESQLAGRLWWKQPMEGEGTFSSWTGATPECWSGLGSAVDEKSDPRRMYLEMLGQANQGTAAVISAGFPRPLRCWEGVDEDLTTLGSLDLAEVKVVFRDKELPSILLAIEPSAAGVLRASESVGDSPAAPVAGKSATTALEKSAAATLSPMMTRLLELRLPVSVLLGRTSISIREVLKLSPGSVVELDRKIGDYVEIVVHGTVVARGEIVSIKGNYGVRIKEVISREDRLALRDVA